MPAVHHDAAARSFLRIAMHVAAIENDVVRQVVERPGGIVPEQHEIAKQRVVFRLDLNADEAIVMRPWFRENDAMLIRYHYSHPPGLRGLNACSRRWKVFSNPPRPDGDPARTRFLVRQGKRPFVPGASREDDFVTRLRLIQHGLEVPAGWDGEGAPR